MIRIESAPTRAGWDCDVEVEGSRHHVTVDRADVERWGGGREPQPDDLVRRSFEFLLEREPVDQILKSFALGDIERYFPEFSEAMAG